MTDFDDNEQSHYDELIRELRELKKFIEDGDDAVAGESAPAPTTGSPDEESSGDQNIPAGKPTAKVDDDEPPTLREAVHRPRKTDELQLDLLSVSTEPAANEDEPRRSDAPDSRDAHDTDPGPIEAGPSAARDEARTRIDLQSPVSDNASSESDDEVLMFVLDLSDKILNTIEDKLLEQSGELLPGEIRDELRDSIGDILYEWCER